MIGPSLLTLGYVLAFMNINKKREEVNIFVETFIIVFVLTGIVITVIDLMYFYQEYMK